MWPHGTSWGMGEVCVCFYVALSWFCVVIGSIFMLSKSLVGWYFLLIGNFAESGWFFHFHEVLGALRNAVSTKSVPTLFLSLVQRPISRVFLGLLYPSRHLFTLGPWCGCRCPFVWPGSSPFPGQTLFLHSVMTSFLCGFILTWGLNTSRGQMENIIII